MGLESATYISDLNSANPLGTDAKSQGDDHLRLLKATLLATFPNITGAMTASHTELNALDGALAGSVVNSKAAIYSAAGQLAATTIAVGTMNIAAGSISDSSGAITFADENLSTSGTLAAGNTTITGTCGVSGALSCAAFTSSGIDDNASAERIQISDNEITYGASGADYGFINAVNDQSVIISGGNAEGAGANILLYGGAHANANDWSIRNATTVVLSYDASANQLNANDNDLLFDAGNGIDFSANTNAAGMTSELLDWYEEGTWTPVLSDGTTPATMSVQVGHYTRIGRQVHIKGRVTCTDITGISGSIRIAGLPFTSDSTANSFGNVTVGWATGLNITAGYSVNGYVQTNDTFINLGIWNATTGTGLLQHGALTAAADFLFEATYYV